MIREIAIAAQDMFYIRAPYPPAVDPEPLLRTFSDGRFQPGLHGIAERTDGLRFPAVTYFFDLPVVIAEQPRIYWFIKTECIG